MSLKIILVEADYGYGNCDSCGYSGHVNVHTHDSISELLKYPEIKQQLVQAGWVPLKEIKEVADKTVLENKFYTSYANGYLREVDPTNLDQTTVNALANKGVLLQRVDAKSVLRPEQYKVVAAAIQRNKNMEKGRAAAQQKRAENAKQRKLEKAKKLLIEAGQLKAPTPAEIHVEMMGS